MIKEDKKIKTGNWELAHYIIAKGADNIRRWTPKVVNSIIDSINDREETANRNLFTAIYQIQMVKDAKAVCDANKEMGVIAIMIRNSTYGTKWEDIDE